MTIIIFYYFRVLTSAKPIVRIRRRKLLRWSRLRFENVFMISIVKILCSNNMDIIVKCFRNAFSHSLENTFLKISSTEFSIHYLQKVWKVHFILQKRGENRQRSFRDRQKSLRNYLLRQNGIKPKWASRAEHRKKKKNQVDLQLLISLLSKGNIVCYCCCFLNFKNSLLRIKLVSNLNKRECE